MSKLTIHEIIPAEPERKYVLELDREEAQMLVNILGAIGRRQYDDIRANSMRPASAWPWDGFGERFNRNPAATVIRRITHSLYGARGLVGLDGKVNR